MASYFCSLKEWTLAEWAATGSIIGKTTVDPEAPSEATAVNKNIAGKKNEGKFNVPTLAGGEKVVAAVIHIYAKVQAEGKGLKFGFVSPAVFSEATETVASKWMTVSLSKAQAEALTQENLNALTVLLEIILGKTTTVYEVYLALETTSGEETKKGTGSLSVGAQIAGTAGPTTRIGVGATSIGPQIKATPGASTRAGLGTVSVGARIQGTPVATGETKKGSGALSVGARLTASGASTRKAAGALSVGVRLTPSGVSVRSTAGSLSLGARWSTSGSTQRRGTGALSGGARISSTYSTTRKGSGSTTTVGVRISGTPASKATKVGRLSAGPRIEAVGRGFYPEPPTGTPGAGHVTVGRTGRLARSTGRISTTNSGRARR